MFIFIYRNQRYPITFNHLKQVVIITWSTSRLKSWKEDAGIAFGIGSHIIPFFIHVVLATFFITTRRRRKSKRASFAIPLAAKTLLISPSWFGDRIPERLAHQISFSREALEIRIRVNRKSQSMPVILHREQYEDTVHLCHGGGLGYSSLWCALTERDTDMSTIVIEHAVYKTCLQTVL